MNQYRRIVSYLYKYGNGKKGENTGFVRIDTRAEGIRLHIRIRDLRMMDEKRLKCTSTSTKKTGCSLFLWMNSFV